MPTAVKEVNLQGFLQTPDGIADGRRSAIQGFGGSSKTAQAVYGFESEADQGIIQRLFLPVWSSDCLGIPIPSPSLTCSNKLNENFKIFRF